MISNGKRNLEWVVQLHDRGKDLIRNDVTSNDIFPSLFTFVNIARHRYIFPVLPYLFINISSSFFKYMKLNMYS